MQLLCSTKQDKGWGLRKSKQEIKGITLSKVWDITIEEDSKGAEKIGMKIAMLCRKKKIEQKDFTLRETKWCGSHLHSKQNKLRSVVGYILTVTADTSPYFV